MGGGGGGIRVYCISLIKRQLLYVNVSKSGDSRHFNKENRKKRLCK